MADAAENRRQALAGFAGWADGEAPSGHAAGQVVAVLNDCVVIDFGCDFAWFRLEHFPTVAVADFVTVGPAVSRWRVVTKRAGQ